MSYIRLICIFEFLAQLSSALWNISVSSTGDSGITLDWYGYPSDLDIAFFILSVNQTTLSPYYDDHDDDDRKLLRILRTFNSSESTFTMKKLPPATEFAAIVYIVDKNNEIIKSERRTFGTEEGGKRFLLYFLTMPTMQYNMQKKKTVTEIKHFKLLEELENCTQEYR